LEDLGHKVDGVDIDDVISQRVLKDYEAVLICTPPNKHTEFAGMCAGVDVPFFLEKPGAIGYRDFVNLEGKVEKSKAINMVACNLRFTPEFRYIQDAKSRIGKPLFATAEFGYYLPWWRKGDYKNYYSCYAMAGGGVLYDAIHEFDYIFTLFGHPDRKAFAASHVTNSGVLDMDVEDAANVFIGYKNGPDVVLHLDYLQRIYRREFHCIGTAGRIDTVFNVADNNEMYRDEMKHFLECVKKGEETCNPVWRHSLTLQFLDEMKTVAGKSQGEEE
jgi:predicted dehydrogenase